MRDRQYRLMLIDDDPVFRLGLRTWLEKFPDLQIVAEASTSTLALEILEQEVANVQLDLVILGLSLGAKAQDQISGLELCQLLKANYSNLRILLLLNLNYEPVLVGAALQLGVNGYCDKGSATGVLLRAIRQVLADRTYLSDRDGMERDQNVLISPKQTISTVAVLRHNFRVSGLNQIDTALARVQTYLESKNLSQLEAMILQGRHRELRAVRWLVGQVLFPSHKNLAKTARAMENRVSPHSDTSIPSTANTATNTAIASSLSDHKNSAILQSYLFDATLAKLQTNLQNLTGIPLEIDILKSEKKRELIYIILRQFEEVLNDLRFAEIPEDQLPSKQVMILSQLWETATTNFFGKYYTLTVYDARSQHSQTVEMVTVMLADAEIVEMEILRKIPLISDLLAHLLFQAPLAINNIYYTAGTSEALARAEIILENLLIKIANAVIQPLLNHFADVEEVKQKFYDYRLIATREIERFRNNLSWRYRLEKYVIDPKAVFESRYDLFAFADLGIKQIDIYAPRTQELRKLEGIQLMVTLALELQDAISPRLRSALSFVGKGIVYVLTNVLGRGIGLVGRGVLQGIGSAWRDHDPRKSKSRIK